MNIDLNKQFGANDLQNLGVSKEASENASVKEKTVTVDGKEKKVLFLELKMNVNGTTHTVKILSNNADHQSAVHDIKEKINRINTTLQENRKSWKDLLTDNKGTHKIVKKSLSEGPSTKSTDTSKFSSISSLINQFLSGKIFGRSTQKNQNNNTTTSKVDQKQNSKTSSPTGGLVKPTQTDQQLVEEGRKRACLQSAPFPRNEQEGMNELYHALGLPDNVNQNHEKIPNKMNPQQQEVKQQPASSTEKKGVPTENLSKVQIADSALQQSPSTANTTPASIDELFEELADLQKSTASSQPADAKQMVSPPKMASSKIQLEPTPAPPLSPEIQQKGVDNSVKMPNFEAPSAEVSPDKLPPSTLNALQGIANFFRPRNKDTNANDGILITPEGTKQVPLSSLSKKESAQAMKSILDTLAKAGQEIILQGGDATNVNITYPGTSQIFNISIIFGNLIDNEWAKSVIDKNPEIKQKFETIQLAFTAIQGGNAFEGAKSAWQTHTPTLQKLASLSLEPGEDMTSETDRGLAPTKQLLGLEKPKNGEPSIAIQDELPIYENKFKEGLARPKEIYVKRREAEIARDSKAGKDVKGLKEQLNPEKIPFGTVLEVISRPVSEFSQRQGDAVNAVKDLFNKHCEKNYEKTYHGIDNQTEEKIKENEMKKNNLIDAGLPDFDHDRGIVIQQFSDYASGKKTLDQVLTAVQFFIEKYPVKSFIKHHTERD